MPQIPVQTIDDPALAPYRELSRSNLTRASGLFIAEGEKVVERLIASRFRLDSILAEPAYAERYASRVDSEVPIYVAPRELFAATVGFHFHRGVLACGRRQPRDGLTRLLANLPGGRSSTLVVCPDVHDPTNLGSIIRSAATFGCNGLIAGRQSADPFSRRVLRVSMGTALELPIVESQDY